MQKYIKIMIYYIYIYKILLKTAISLFCQTEIVFATI